MFLDTFLRFHDVRSILCILYFARFFFPFLHTLQCFSSFSSIICNVFLPFLQNLPCFSSFLCKSSNDSYCCSQISISKITSNACFFTVYSTIRRIYYQESRAPENRKSHRQTKQSTTIIIQPTYHSQQPITATRPTLNNLQPGPAHGN